MMTIGLLKFLQWAGFDLDIQLSRRQHARKLCWQYATLFASAFGILQIDALNLEPDNPSVSGAISGVENVYIYPYSNITVV
jgi:hypothetical protein